METPLMNRFTSLEYLVVAMAIAYFYLAICKFDWYWLVAIYAAIDFSMIGYLGGPRSGAIVYNLFHSLIGPALLMIAYIASLNQILLLLVLGWLFHIFVDRTLGYGLKHVSSFHHTHLGPIGKAKRTTNKRSKKSKR